jgi:hypothetical protein
MSDILTPKHPNDLAYISSPISSCWGALLAPCVCA